MRSFLLLVKLFRPFDDALVGLWNKTRAGCQQAYLAVLDKQYREVAQAFMATDAQFGDASKNQQWLKNMVWQIDMANGNAGDNSYPYQMEVPGEVLTMATSFATVQGMHAANVGLVEKLLAITAGLTDVLPLQPASRVSYIHGPRESLGQILNFLAVVRNGEHRFMPLLWQGERGAAAAHQPRADERPRVGRLQRRPVRRLRQRRHCPAPVRACRRV